MKMLADRIKSALNNKKGETIVEVVVAFALLSIMLVIFTQGLAWASNTEMRASDNRKKADDTMISLQDKLATEQPGYGAPLTYPNDSSKVLPFERYTYSIDGTNYVVYEYT